MGFEQPNNPEKSHRFDAILDRLKQSPKVEKRIVEINGVSCEVSQHTSEPDNWTVYLEGMPYAVTKMHDGTLKVDDVSNSFYDAMITNTRKALARAAVEQTLLDIS